MGRFQISGAGSDWASSPRPASLQELQPRDAGRLSGQLLDVKATQILRADGLAPGGEVHLIPGLSDRFKDVTFIPLHQTDEQKRFWETVLAPAGTDINQYGDAAMIDQKLNELETDLSQRRDRYQKAFNEAQDPKMQAYYNDLRLAMALDVMDIATARTLPTSLARGEAYNRIALEAHIEVKYNVDLINNGGRDWTSQELRGIEAGLAQLPYKQTVESDSLSLIRKVDMAVINGLSAGGVHQPDGTIDLANVPGGGTVVGFSDLIIHEVGHGQQPPPALFDEFKAISGWKKIGNQDDQRLAEFSTGDWLKASTLRAMGFQVDGADDQYYQLSKSQGEALVVPSPPPPHGSDKFVSDYARTDPMEDFAETYLFYYTHREEMRTKFPEKFDFMEKNFGPKT